MRNRFLYTILFSVLLAFLFLPMVQEHYKFFKVKPLNGVNYKTEYPKLTYETYSSNKYQAQLEKYIAENFGFREFVIRLYNQYVWTFYNKTFSHFLIPGKENWLYYTEAVNDYYGTEQKKIYDTPESAKDWFDRNARLMCQLRNILKEYNVEFLSFIAPSKPFVYPEYLPKGEKDTTAINAAEYYDKILTETGFPHIEMTKWFKAMRDTLPYPVFGNMDMHWQFTAVYAYDSLFKLMNSLNNFGIPELRYGTPIVNNDFVPDDEGTLNLLFPVRNKTTNYKLEVGIDSTINNNKPKILFVGDSFVWAFGKLIPWKHLLKDNEVWYYNSSVYQDFIKQNIKKDRSYILRNLLKFDFIIFYTSAHQWNKATYGFVEDALLALCVSDSLMEDEVNRIADSLNITKYEAKKMIDKTPELIKGLNSNETPSIRNNEDIKIAQVINHIEDNLNWIELLKIYSLSKNISLEETYRKEALNVIENRPLLRDSSDFYNKLIFDIEKTKLIDKWKSDPKMMDFLRNKSKEKNKSIETILEEDAEWVLNQEGTKRKNFEEIKDELLFHIKVCELVEQWRLNPDMMSFLENKAREKGKDIETVLVEDAKWFLIEEQKKQQ